MKADRVEISRDESSSRWLVRIQIGEEVVRRYCDGMANADPESVRRMAAKTVADEGYSVDPSEILFT